MSGLAVTVAVNSFSRGSHTPHPRSKSAPDLHFC